MLSLHVDSIENKSIEDRLYEQAISAHLLSEEQFLAIVEVFNREQISLDNFWKYVTGERIKRDGHVSAQAVGDAISEVLNVEEFNRLIASDITWVK